MRDFDQEFRGNPDSARNWPGTAQGSQLADGFNLFSRVLFESAAGHKRASEVSVTPADAGLHARLVAFLDGYQNPGGAPTGGWPKQDASIPAQGDQKAVSHRTVRLWEVATALQALLGGVATTLMPGDGAGDAPSWPPHSRF